MDEKEKSLISAMGCVEIISAKHERTETRLLVALCIVLAIALAVMTVAFYLTYKINAKWLDAWSSYDYESEVVTVDGTDGGNARYIGDNSHYHEGDVNYGEGYG